MIEAMRLFLFDQAFEDADVFALQNFDSEDLIRIRLPINWENETVEREKLHGIGSCDR